MVKFTGEQLCGPTDWAFSESHHVIVVHRAGVLKRLSSQFSTGLSANTLPSKGDCWVIPAGTDYAAEAVGDSVEYCELHLPVGIIGRDFVAAAGTQDRFLYHAIEQLAVLRPYGDDISELLRDNIVQGIRLHLKGYKASAFDSGERYASVIAALESYLRDTLSKRHSLDEMATFTSLAPSTLLRHFRRNFGMTPYRWLLERRIEKSKELLRATKATITDIALDVGFSTPSHFSDQFRKLVGCSPREYRAAIKR